MRRRSKRWQRESTVIGTFRISVVANRNFHMRRRLLERLQQAVESLRREHVHLVDDIDLVARIGRAIAHALDDLSDVAYAGMGGGIHLDHIDMAALDDRLAMPAHHGQIDGRAAAAIFQFMIEGARENAGGGRLADAAHPGEDIGLVHAPRGKGVADGAHHRLLADEIAEMLRPVFARKHGIRRGGLHIGGISHRRAQRLRQAGRSRSRAPGFRAAPIAGRRPGPSHPETCRTWEASYHPPRHASRRKRLDPVAEAKGS